MPLPCVRRYFAHTSPDMGMPVDLSRGFIFWGMLNIKLFMEMVVGREATSVKLLFQSCEILPSV